MNARRQRAERIKMSLSVSLKSLKFQQIIERKKYE